MNKDDPVAGTSAGPLDPKEERRQSLERCIEHLLHACSCKDLGCSQTACHKMKRVVAHTRLCKRKSMNAGCNVCKQLVAMCVYHSRRCHETKCIVPFCEQIKIKLRQRVQFRPVQARFMGRRAPTTAAKMIWINDNVTGLHWWRILLVIHRQFNGCLPSRNLIIIMHVQFCIRYLLTYTGFNCSTTTSLKPEHCTYWLTMEQFTKCIIINTMYI